MAAGVVSAPLIIASSSSHTHASRREIHTDTLVFIQSADTPGALIFYTLDGSRPEPDQSGSAARSRKYSKPVRLPAGRVAVRAVAVASDGRRSSTVTKMFVVQRREAGVEEKVPEVNQVSKQRLGRHGDAGLKLKTAGVLASLQRCSDVPRGGGDPNSVSSLECCWGPLPVDPPHHHGEPASLPQKPVHGPPSGPVQGSDPLKQLRSTQTSRLVQDPEVLWDQQVLTARPPDPFSLFFPICGAKISHQTFPSRGTEQGHRVCGCCGSGNPVNVSSCLTCESCLQPQREPSSSGCWLASEDLAPWCGVSGPAPSLAAPACCAGAAAPAAILPPPGCASCGVFLRAPTPPTAPPGEEPLHGEVVTKLDRFHAEAMTGGSQQATPPPDCAWKMLRPPQTDPRRPWGSSTRRPLRGSRAGGRRSPRRRPPLTSVSPGKGYWRRQLDHVCAHLRSYTQNNAPFRALLGDPCMGQLLSAVVQDDQQQLTLTISFALAHQKTQVCGSTCTSSSTTPTQTGLGEGLDLFRSGSCDLPMGVWGEVHPHSHTHTRRGLTGGDVLPGGGASKPGRGRDAQLMMELAPGRGQLSIVQQLLDQGADPACCHSNGRHPLALAVLNGHHQVLPELVQRGAPVDQQSGPMKNTALHEAAALAPEGLPAAELLLSCGASVGVKNASGQTAFQLAADSGCNQMVSLLAAQTGLVLLGKLASPSGNVQLGAN
uniref:Uncharacterized protein n=1 Tax=Tetraodon nigroviridis TaxID=99883 RepID=H3BXD7_TETNG